MWKEELSVCTDCQHGLLSFCCWSLFGGQGTYTETSKSSLKKKKKGKGIVQTDCSREEKERRGRACKGGVPNQSFQRTQNGRVSLH